MSKPANLTVEEVFEVLDTFAFNSCDDIWWRHVEGGEDLMLLVNCSDVFAWGCADAEEITSENIHLLREARDEIRKVRETEWKYENHDVGNLFVAKVRKQRPQGAMYKYIDDNVVHLFDACGPAREKSFDNPKPQASELENAQQKT